MEEILTSIGREKISPHSAVACQVTTPPASISLAICRWCDICIFNVRNKDVVVVGKPPAVQTAITFPSMKVI